MLLVVMGAALTGVVILTVGKGYGKSYPGYLIFIVAMYTFWKVISSVANMIKAGKFKSPLITGMKNIGYADALVSMLSLQTAMFASFGKGDAGLAVTMNTLTGAFVCVMIGLMGIFMVISAQRQRKHCKKRTVVSPVPPLNRPEPQ